MAAIMDRWVPSRRLKKKRERALQETLDARFGDMHITAPTAGSWNQAGSDVGKQPLEAAVPGAGWSPDLSVEKPMSETTLSTEEIEDDALQKEDRRHHFTITIPLPWSMRKSHNRTTSTKNSTATNSTRKDYLPELSPRSVMSTPEPTPRSIASSPDLNSGSVLSSPDTILQSRSASPVVIYKPASEEYKQQLAEMTNGINRVDSSPSPPPDRSQSVSPANVVYKPASDDFAREMAEFGMGPSPAIPQRETLSRPRAPSQPTSIRSVPDPRPIPLRHSPEPHTPPMGLPPDPRATSPGRARETPVPAMMGLPTQPSIGAARSSSRGPAIDGTGTTRPASRGPGSERAGPPRSSSRGPALNRMGSTRSASRGPQGPACERAGPPRSSSRGPTLNRIGSTRSASRGPGSERAGPPRSSSRGPTLDKMGRTRSASQGPSSDRLPTTRSASRGPLSERSANAIHGRSSSRGPTYTPHPYHESTSSDTSIDSHITPPPSPPTLHHTFDNTKNTHYVTENTAAEVDNKASVGGPAGYYTGVAQEYRRIASDVEDSEHRSRELEESRRAKKKDSGFQGPQEMVPDTDELW